ncbi:MAG: right-handed parallel beta-helix repeat-containing protein [Dehalococcoidia bacterium]
MLCQKAVFELRDTISFTDENQWLYTQGFPTDDARALLRIVDRGVATAVSTGNRSGVKLSHVIIDGNRPELGIAEGGLIEWGGNGTGHVVEWVKAYEPRGWSVLVIGHGDDLVCSGSIARNNELGPAGRAEYIIADGISLACRNSIVENNTIIDATDGGIVIFQAPGSLVANNTIRAETRITFYGISMVDTGPYDGDFSGTRVTGNVIDARGALIRHGIDMGPYVGCIPPKEMTSRSFGAVVADNVLMGNHMGYGFVVSGVRDWTVTGNVDLSTHLGPEGGMDCFGQPVDPPGGFQFNPSTSNGTFQEEFEEAVFGFASSLWPLQTVVSEECVEDLLGAEVLEEIKAGERGPLWFALETAPKGEFIGRCISEYQPPEIGDLPGEVQVGVQACEPLCAEVVLFNISETDTADMRKAEFLLESLPVQCVGLLEFLGPGVQVRCIIEDYVTPGFQVLNWYGFPFIGDQSGWGFHYPFQE